ncbi:MAG: DUF1906 domain-containing protein [Clostridia bacterium]|nr:DUF1906 domain-containing protein [Clostridia bacterium]
MQIELGESLIDGIIGNGTIQKFDAMFPNGLSQNVNNPNENIVYIMQGGFYCRGIDPYGFNGVFGNGLTDAVKTLQSQAGLENQNGIITSLILKAILSTDAYTLVSNGDTKVRQIQQDLNRKYYEYIGLIKQTWASLMISYGDKNRTATACDTNTPITPNFAKLLKKNGYNIVGRYLADTDKGLKEGELSTIFNGDLKMFPIYQGNGRVESDFSEAYGLRDARTASRLALSSGLPEGTIIYFAVDYDATDHQVANSILPYFKGVNFAIDKRYKVGVYGPRNICTRVKNAGYSVSSFVSDMSGGFSGNIGYKLPDDWEYDQIANTRLNDSEYGSLEIDRVVYRGNILPVVSYDLNIELYHKLEKVYDYAQEYLESKGNDSIANRNSLVLQYLRSKEYADKEWIIVAGKVDEHFIKFLNTKDDVPAVDSFRVFIKSANSYMPIAHMAATAQIRFKHNDITVQNQWVDLTGIFGDLMQLGGKIQEKYDSNPEKYHYDQFAIMELIGCPNNETAQKYGFSNSIVTGFNWEDWYQDIDGVNIALKLENTPIHEAFENYYTLGGVNKRYSSFFTNIGLVAYAFAGEIKYDTIYRKAYSYTSGTETLTAPFEMFFGNFNNKLWGDVLAKAFASVLSGDLMNEE